MEASNTGFTLICFFKNGYNLHTIMSTLLQYTIQWFLVFHMFVQPSLLIWEYFHTLIHFRSLFSYRYKRHETENSKKDPKISNKTGISNCSGATVVIKGELRCLQVVRTWHSYHCVKGQVTADTFEFCPV